MPRKRTVKMLGNYCPACFRLHDPPACDQDIEKSCPKCGLPFGGLTLRMDGSQCWWCVSGRPRPTGPTQPPLCNEPDWWETQ
jgi:hypothetical protein